jgi:transcriptional regulator with XRE-family HTH domain
MTPKTLAARLKMARKLKGFTKSGLDARAGLTRGHTRQIEAGLKPNPEAGTASKLARALEIDLAWLIDGVGSAPSKVIVGTESVARPA